jgi:glycosyl hydrolase family 76
MPLPLQHLACCPLPIVRLCTCLLVLASTAFSADSGSAVAQQVAGVARAAAAMQRLDADFFGQRLQTYTATRLKNGPIVSVWPVSQVLAASADLYGLTHSSADRDRLYRIADSLQAYLGKGDVYHTRTFPSARYSDDNNWIALALLHAYDLTGDRRFLVPAEHAFAYAVTSWDSAEGGVLWADTRRDRPTASTAPAITIGLRLAGITGNAWYRRWADRFYSWENAYLRRPDGLYWDHFLPDGSIDRDIVSYNQGAMIEANLAYYALLHRPLYRARAVLIARSAARALPGPWHSRGMYADFDGIYAAALAHLDALRPGVVDLGPARAFLDWAWPLAIAPHTGPRRTEYDLLEQAGYVIAAASLAGA